MAEAIRIGEPAIEIRLRRHAGVRRMVLRVVHGGPTPTLTLPPRVTIARAKAFLVEHETWLRGQLALRAPGARIADGAVLPFRGGELAVRRRESGRIERRDGELLVPGPADACGPRVAAWLREEARAACVTAAGHYAARIGVAVGRITLRDPRSRWGSCNAKGDLMFSWRLVMAPPEVLDYVAAHEVAHIAELNHSPQFWGVVRRLVPDFEGPRDWLRREGAELHRLDFGTREG